jgi:hypothetical protein
MKCRLYDVRPLSKVYGVYSKDFGPDGGWHLIKTFSLEEDANRYVIALLRKNS